MRSAVIVVDVVKDNVELGHRPDMVESAKGLIDKINQLTAGARRRDWPVVFATDSFLPGDGIFRGRMKEHSLRGSEGAQVSALLTQEPQDTWLPKRRLSAFYKTDLDQTLRLWGVERVLVCGLMTPYCVLMTALDAVSLDFHAVLVEDACMAHSPAAHQACLDIYRKNPLDPILRVLSMEESLAS